MILLSIVLPAHAGKSPFKFGKAEMDLLKQNHTEKYPNADAVVLSDYGDISFEFFKDKGWVHIYKRECRIKILNDEGYKWATDVITTYDGNKIEEKVTQLKGYTYNLVNGKLERTKLSKESIFTDKVNDKYTKTKFTMPDVKEGSLIEFSYEITSNYMLVLPEWKFQRSIPVERSELYASP